MQDAPCEPSLRVAQHMLSSFSRPWSGESGDSAYSSGGGRRGAGGSGRGGVSSATARFCHECGAKYPTASAKFCCECGLKRMAIR